MTATDDPLAKTHLAQTALGEYLDARTRSAYERTRADRAATEIAAERIDKAAERTAEATRLLNRAHTTTLGLLVGNVHPDQQRTHQIIAAALASTRRAIREASRVAGLAAEARQLATEREHVAEMTEVMATMYGDLLTALVTELEAMTPVDAEDPTEDDRVAARSHTRTPS